MIRNYIKTTSKIKKEITFFLISDLHYFKPKDLKKCQFILEEIHKRKPAYLIIAGDLLDSSNIAHEHFFINFIKACALETTVLIGIGNHDITFIENKRTLYDRNKNFWKQLNKIKNVYVLDNKNFETDELCIFGITLPYSYYYEKLDVKDFLNQYLTDTNSQKLNMLLAHDPSITSKYDMTSYDIVLSGHTHNGTIPKILEKVAKNRGLISPAKKFFPEKIRGRFWIKNTDIIISGGITKLSKRSKLSFLDAFWAHELTIITLKPE